MFNSFKKRLIIGVGLILAVTSSFAAQPPTIGILQYGTKSSHEDLFSAFAEGLSEGGFVDRRNLRIEHRYANFDHRKLEELAEELVRAKVQVLYASNPWSVHAAKSATKTIPIVFSGVNDPVGIRFVKSLARPGGNITGITTTSNELTAKRLELMKDMFPAATRIGVVYDKDVARACRIEITDIGRASQHLGIDITEYGYLSASELRTAFTSSQRSNVAAVLIPTSMEVRRVGAELIRASVDNRIPTIHSDRAEVEAGGLMSYGPDSKWAARRAGTYVARILKGTKPEDLPVEQPMTYELVINMKTARALGVKIPDSVMMRATHLIQ